MSRLVFSRRTRPSMNGSVHLHPELARPFILAMGVGVASLGATELMRYLLVPDIGHRWERWLAETVSAAIVALLTVKLIHSANQLRAAALLRMQVISEMNHHIRNALAAICMSTESIENQQCMQTISESVDRIEWALREILLRRKPLPEPEINRRLFSTSPHPEHQSRETSSSFESQNHGPERRKRAFPTLGN